MMRTIAVIADTARCLLHQQVNTARSKPRLPPPCTTRQELVCRRLLAIELLLQICYPLHSVHSRWFDAVFFATMLIVPIASQNQNWDCIGSRSPVNAETGVDDIPRQRHLIQSSLVRNITDYSLRCLNDLRDPTTRGPLVHRGGLGVKWRSGKWPGKCQAASGKWQATGGKRQAAKF